jgi:hypothetical protein
LLRKLFIFSITLLAILLLHDGHAFIETEVTSTKAIVYADQEMTSPVGTIPKGTRLMIGEKARQGGRVRTAVVNKRLVYIKSSDLQVDNIEIPIASALKKHRKHQVPDQIDGTIFIDKLNKNNYFNFTFGQFKPGDQWDNLSTQNGGDSGGILTSYQLMIEHRPPAHNTYGGIGLGYYTVVQQKVSFSAITLDSALYWSPIYKQFFSVDIYLMGQVSAGVEVDGKSWREDRTGSLLGISLGTQVRWLPFKKLGVMAGMSIKRFMLNGLDQLPTDSGTIVLDKLNGLAVVFGIVYRIQ